MITMWDRFMTASCPVFVVGGVAAAIMIGCALIRVGLANRQRMLVNMIIMNMVQMTIVNVVHMTVMFYGHVPTTKLVFVIMV